MDARVVVSDVRKRFGRNRPWVLAGVDLHIAPGSLTTIVGDNGSGKSTLLRIVAGLSEPTSGEVVRTDGSIAFAPERLSSRVRMSARVYFDHLARMRGLDLGDARRTVGDLADRLRLEPGLTAPIRSLSKGNSQKVALIQAFMAPVALILLDEPDSGLDPGTRDVVDGLIDERVDDGASVVVASHRSSTTATSHQTLAIRDGRLSEHHGSPPSTRLTRLEVTHPDAGADGHMLRASRGVVDVEHAPGCWLIDVDENFSDLLLGTVLAGGWSVRSVRPLRDNSKRPPT